MPAAPELVGGATPGGVAAGVVPGLDGLPTAASWDEWAQVCTVTLERGLEQCLGDALVTVTEDHGQVVAADAMGELMGTVPEASALCHGPVHRMGQASYERAGTVMGALVPGSAVCELGYYHGVLEAWGLDVPSGDVRSQVQGLCSAVTERDRSFPGPKCSHAIGHAAWPASGGSVGEALQICELLDGDRERTECGVGVTMAMGEDLPGIPRYEPGTVADVVGLCDSFPGGHRAACVAQTGPLMLEVAAGDVAEALRGCALLGNDGSAAFHCMVAVGYSAPQFGGWSVGGIVDVCSVVGASDMADACLVGAAAQVQLRSMGANRDLLADLCAVVADRVRPGCGSYTGRAAEVGPWDIAEAA